MTRSKLDYLCPWPVAVAIVPVLHLKNNLLTLRLNFAQAMIVILFFRNNMHCISGILLKWILMITHDDHLLKKATIF